MISRKRRVPKPSFDEIDARRLAAAWLCRLTILPFSLLLKQFGNGAESIIYLISSLELSCNVRFKDDDVRAFGWTYQCRSTVFGIRVTWISYGD